MHIPYLVKDTIDFDASDPYDRLFALYGISADAHNVADLPPEVQPDYRKPIHEVSCRLCKMEYQGNQFHRYSSLLGLFCA
jgi:hypothetical protein